MNKVYALLGGNIGNVLNTFEKAIEKINLQIGPCTAKSNVYVSEPWGFKSSKFFYNQALIIETDLGPEEVLKHFLLIEKLLGRQRPEKKQKYESRNIDIDILFFNDIIHESDILQIPHPLVHLRSFALLPLVEIAPTLLHPKLNSPIVKVLSDCEDISYIRNIKLHDPDIVLY